MNAQDIVYLLNEVLELDKNAIFNLIEQRVFCNEDLGNHPTIMVTQENDKLFVGLLGIINGVVAWEDKVVVAQYSEDGELLRFVIKDKKKFE